MSEPRLTIEFEGARDEYSEVPMTSCAQVVIVTDGDAASRAQAVNLRAALREQIWFACGVAPDVATLHLAGQRSDCKTIIVFIMGGQRLLAAGPQFPLDATVIVIGPPDTMFPTSLGTTAAETWRNGAAEFVPRILAAAGLTANDARVFLSYRRDEARGVADQLFDALQREKFDVFLDRFRIDAGVDFKQRIRQELAHKSMAVFVESKTLVSARWTKYEIAVAKSSRIGVFAIHLPGGTAISHIDETRRFRVGALAGGELNQADLGQAVDRIKTAHSISQMRRRLMLRQSMQRALASAGVSEQMLINGVIYVKPKRTSSTHYLIWVPSRPAELFDFHFASVAPPLVTLARVIVGPAAHFVGDDRQRMQWLAGVAGVHSFDESRMLEVARAMRQERL